MEAEIITIGTELLLGEIVDTNTRFIAHALREIGLDLYRTSSVGDNAERIAQAVKESKSENNRRQAYLPQGAIAIENPIGTAPGFIIDAEDSVVVALQGVPAEMRHLLEKDVIPYLRTRFQLSQIIKTRLLRTAGVGESWLDNQIHDLEHLSNPSVGLAAHPGRVDIRITAKADTREAAEEMLTDVETTIRQRVDDAIYGIDDEQLKVITLKIVANHGWRMVVVECGTDGEITAGLTNLDDTFAGGQVFHSTMSSEDLEKELTEARDNFFAEVGLGVVFQPEENRHFAMVLLQTPGGDELIERSYGGPPVYANKWVMTIALDLLRRRLA